MGKNEVNVSDPISAHRFPVGDADHFIVSSLSLHDGRLGSLLYHVKGFSGFLHVTLNTCQLNSKLFLWVFHDSLPDFQASKLEVTLVVTLAVDELEKVQMQLISMAIFLFSIFQQG